MLRLIIIGLLVVCGGLTFMRSTLAGELTYPNTEACDAKFTGEIDARDLGAFKKFADGAGYEPLTLCLDSPEGGDLSVALEVLDMIWTANIDTAILPGDGCASACALIFIAGGNVQGTDLTRQVERNMHAGARLGFHGPSLDLPPGRSQRTEVVVEAYNSAIQVAAELFSINQIKERREVILPDFLLSMILQTPAERMYWIEHVGDAILSDVRIVGIQYPEVNSKAAPNLIRNICANTLATFPPKDSYYATTPTAPEHYQLTINSSLYLDDDKEENLKNNWFVDQLDVEFEIGTDGSLLGVSGPFWSGSKYYEIYCIVSVSKEIEGDEWYGTGVAATLVESYPENSIEHPSDVSDEAWGGTIPLPAIYAYHPGTMIDDLPRVNANSALASVDPLGQEDMSSLSEVYAREFRMFSGFDLLMDDSEDLERHNDVSMVECLDKCEAAGSNCIAVTYDRWNQVCFLKDWPVGDLVRNSKADTVVRRISQRYMRLSTLPIRTYLLEDMSFQLDGSFERVTTENAKDCLQICVQSDQCEAIDYKEGQCVLLDRPGAYVKGGAGTVAGFFEQR
ncbi:PAN domain-containing protein [Pararhizobium sp. IMCC21322]|uniref:PAN domain-containing protein n=1 Tax=Pararhizobium sp. IMCC21322 TaxID=3067903 RepID=UPI00274062CD|nr:PAN domain-containing protein [Pararhizobium sp. IMCC21322]